MHMNYGVCPSERAKRSVIHGAARNFLRALCGLLVSLPAMAAMPEPQATSAILIDASAMPAKQRSAITARKGSGEWWLGVQNQLLVAGKSADLQSLKSSYPLLAQFDNVTPKSFSYQSLACDEREAKLLLPAILRAGRGNLVRTPRNFSGYDVINGLSAITPNLQVVSTSRMARSKVVQPELAALVARLSPARWFADITKLASWKRNSFSPEIDLARDWLAAQFTSSGLLVTLQTFNVGSASTQVENVIGTQIGSTFPDEWIVIGAHYDSRNVGLNNITNPSPGAEDNASGCAAVLEMARLLKNTRPKRTIKYMCYGGEEQNLYGSQAYVDALVASGELGKIKLAIIMDMIGYASNASQLGVLLETSNALAGVFPLFQQTAADYSPGMTVTTSVNPFGSDHIPFINRAVPSLLLIEPEYDSYPQYHKATDTPANITNALLQGPAIMRMMLATTALRADLDLGILVDGFE
jgi:hypothetical protein